MCDQATCVQVCTEWWALLRTRAESAVLFWSNTSGGRTVRQYKALHFFENLNVGDFPARFHMYYWLGKNLKHRLSLLDNR